MTTIEKDIAMLRMVVDLRDQGISDDDIIDKLIISGCTSEQLDLAKKIFDLGVAER